MLKNIVIDTQGPIAEALRLGIAALVEKQAEIAHQAAPKMQALYDELRELDMRRAEIQEQMAQLKSDNDRALGNIEYLKRQQAVVDGVLAEA